MQLGAAMLGDHIAVAMAVATMATNGCGSRMLESQTKRYERPKSTFTSPHQQPAPILVSRAKIYQ